MGPHCSFCGTSTGPFRKVKGLFRVLICIPYLEARQAQPDTLLGRGKPSTAPRSNFRDPSRGSAVAKARDAGLGTNSQQLKVDPS